LQRIGNETGIVRWSGELAGPVLVIADDQRERISAAWTACCARHSAGTATIANKDARKSLPIADPRSGIFRNSLVASYSSNQWVRMMSGDQMNGIRVKVE
jgi:hypothetical protein